MKPRGGASAHRNAAGAAENIDSEAPSKSSRKREMHALQDIGEQLVALPADRLARVPMPEPLLEAVKDAQRFTKHEARRRQMQYIGRLMRHIDPAPIQACLDAFSGQSRAETARHHRLERLRGDFIEDEKTVSRIVELWPHADVQYLRNLRRNALKEQQQNKPPRAFRLLFKALRELDEGRAPDVMPRDADGVGEEPAA